MKPTYEDLEIALAESVKLQAHYAKLINMHDGGERAIFPTSEEWIARLRETGKLPKHMTLKAAYDHILGGCIAISPDMYGVALRDIAKLCGREVDDAFKKEVRDHERTLPSYCD